MLGTQSISEVVRKLARSCHVVPRSGHLLSAQLHWQQCDIFLLYISQRGHTNILTLDTYQHNTQEINKIHKGKATQLPLCLLSKDKKTQSVITSYIIFLIRTGKKRNYLWRLRNSTKQC